jgi:hypothetical protein
MDRHAVLEEDHRGSPATSYSFGWQSIAGLAPSPLIRPERRHFGDVLDVECPLRDLLTMAGLTPRRVCLNPR